MGVGSSAFLCLVVIDGGIPVILYMCVLEAKIDGDIPPMDMKNVRIGNFALHNRKSSPYLPRNELHFANSGKCSAYFFALV